jgi:hypothetical protein
VLAGVDELRYRPFTDRWDEPWIEDAARIGEHGISLANVIVRDDDLGLAIFTPAGHLNLRYAGLTIETEHGTISRDTLRDAVRRYWTEWRATATLVDSHPLVRAAMDVPWTPALLVELVVAWREHRTSELSDTISIVDLAIRGARPAQFRGPADADRWIATWSDNVSGALEELAERASWTHVATIERELGGTPTGDQIRVVTGPLWEGITRCVGGLRDALADPRIGRGLHRLLYSNSDHYFRVDQVAHAVMSFAKPHDDPSFADHLFPLLELHADGGTSDALVDEAYVQSIECDCNGAEMAGRLRDLATTLAARYPNDRTLAPATAQALRERALA